jgi:glycosyltransferase involved in cell wall biosynthesis
MKKKERNYKQNPLVSIITVVKNNEKYLEETIQSVKNQSYNNFEYIVLDGNSTDRSLDIIKKYDSDIDFWLSEEDKGIYDAFNKGLSLARGKFIVFVNSDDILLKDATKMLKKYDEKYPNIDFLFGSVKKHWGILSGYRPWKLFYSWGFYSSHSTGFYVKKDAAEKIGKYNLKYLYSADYDYFYRMIVHHKLKGVGTKKNELFGIFRRGGYSSKIKFIDHLFETTKIRLDNGQNKFLILVIFILKFFKNFKRL